MHLLCIFDRWVSTVVIDFGFQEISMKKRLETSFFVVVAWIFCMSLCGSDVIDIGFQEISMKRLETSFFCGSCMHLLYIFDRWVSTVVIDIGFQEISIKWDETSFFVVVAWIYIIYSIDESL